MRYFLAVMLIFILSLPSFAGEAGRWGLGINLGALNNYKMWTAASGDSGTMLRIDYSYDFNDFYTAALELAYYVDQNVFKSTAATTYVETAAILNIDHIFHTTKIGPLLPYLKFGTALYGNNLLRKTNDAFYSVSSDIAADFNAGLGAEFKLGKATLNTDLTFPGLAHVIIFNQKVVYVFSLGWKQYF
jgi:hypothetical protein